MSSPRASALPDSLRAALAQVGAKLERQQDVSSVFSGVTDQLNRLPPGAVISAERELAEAAQLSKWRRPYPKVTRLFGQRVTDADQLENVPGLEQLFIFHRDGFIREAALRKFAGPISSGFMLAAIAWRLNDWVRPVRAAAEDCARRTFPATQPGPIAEAALALLGRERSWGRWTSERSVLDDAFARSDVAASLAERIISSGTGPAAMALRHACRKNALDPYLQRIAREAIQPSVRAVAAQSLIDGYASWPDGWGWQWVDKSMGIRRRETIFARRDLEHAPSRIRVIEECAKDRAAVVRRVALAGLIRISLDTPEAKRIAMSLLSDRSRSNRERAKFIVEWGAAAAGEP